MFQSRLFFWALTSSLAGFLFGFDTVVISGAEKKIKALWDLSSFEHGLAMSAALWGTVLGALTGGFITDCLGRRWTLLSVGILYLVSAIGSGIAGDPITFMLARFVGGVGVGVATVASPLYISEISPASRRGVLAGLFQFNIVFGILIAFVSNFLIGKYIDPQIAWRWMLGIEAVPALIYTVLCFMLPESPRWYIIRKGMVAKAREVFAKINPEKTAEEIQDLVEQVEASRAAGAVKAGFFTKRLSRPILLAFLIALFNQLSGINAVLYFAPRIFEMTGLDDQAALLQSIGIGVTNLIFTFVGLYLIDRLGRRTLLILGSAGYIVSLGLCSFAFSVESFGIVPFCIFAFIAAHAVGQGAVIWVFLSEIFPNSNRAAGQSFGCFTVWFFAASLTFIFPKMVEAMAPSVIFGFFCSMMIIQLVWVLRAVPETKGIALEEIQKRLGIQ